MSFLAKIKGCPCPSSTPLFLIINITLCLTGQRVSSEMSSHILQTNCTCVGYPLTFQCTAVGAGATVWQGSAFNCPRSSNKIQLFHSQFLGGNITRSCNDGNIVGYSLGVAEELHFNSQLDVHEVTAEMNGTTVECIYDDGAEIHTIYNAKIVPLKEFDYPPPTNIRLSNISEGSLMFIWDPVEFECSNLVQYKISAANCGKCSNVTSSPNITCTDLVVQNEQMCMLNVSTIICLHNVGGREASFEVLLKVPDETSYYVKEVTPTYDNNTGQLMMLTTKFINTSNSTIHLSNDMNVSTVAYTINYTDSNSGQICHTGTVSVNSCVDGVCTNVFPVSASQCPPQTNITTKIFGTNIFGTGNNSSAIERDFLNTFVKLIALPGIIVCSFLDVSGSEFEASCQINYFDKNCDQLRENYSDHSNDDVVLLPSPTRDGTLYCFKVTASYGTMKVNIHGSVQTQIEPSHTSNEKLITLATLLPILITLGVLFVTILPCGVHLKIKNQRASYCTDQGKKKNI